MLVGYWLAVAGFLLNEGDADGGFAPVLIGLGLAVIAGTVVGSALITGHGLARGVVAVVVGGAIGLVVLLLRSDEVPLPALAAALSVAAALAISRAGSMQLRVRLLMAGGIFLYVWWVTVFSAPFAILITPLLPYPTVGVSDFAVHREEERRSRLGYADHK